MKKSGNEREGQKLNGEGTKLQYCPSVETPQILIQTSWLIQKISLKAIAKELPMLVPCNYPSKIRFILLKIQKEIPSSFIIRQAIQAVSSLILQVQPLAQPFPFFPFHKNEYYSTSPI